MAVEDFLVRCVSRGEDTLRRLRHEGGLAGETHDIYTNRGEYRDYVCPHCSYQVPLAQPVTTHAWVTCPACGDLGRLHFCEPEHEPPPDDAATR